MEKIKLEEGIYLYRFEKALGHAIGLNTVVIENNGEALLVDTGYEANFLELKDDLDKRNIKITNVVVSHFHPDHTADLIHFLFATKYPPSFKKRKPFVISGSHGLSEFMSRLQEAYDHWLTLPPEIMEIDEIDTQEKVERKYPGFKITTRPTNHTPNSLAYRLESRSGKSVVYSGDTGFCEEIIDLAKGADLLILECSFPDGKEVELHLTPSQACRIATLAGINRLLLIHFYPECLATDITAQCRKSYTGELILGSDFLHINI